MLSAKNKLSKLQPTRPCHPQHPFPANPTPPASKRPSHTTHHTTHADRRSTRRTTRRGTDESCVAFARRFRGGLSICASARGLAELLASEEPNGSGANGKGRCPKQIVRSIWATCDTKQHPALQNILKSVDFVEALLNVIY